MPTPPKNPDFFDKVNYVTQAWSSPCRAPWWIYVETAAPAALDAIITLLSFDLADVMRAYFRPAGLGKGGHHRARGKKRFLKGLGIPEIGEMIGKEIPGQKELSMRRYGGLQRWFWLIDNELQKGFFWWMVADVANDFAFNWTSQLYKTIWCHLTGLGWCSAENNSGQLVGAHSDWGLIKATENIEGEGTPVWIGVAGHGGGKNCFVGLAFEVTSTGPGANPRVLAEITDGLGGVTTTEYSAVPQADGTFSFAQGGQVSRLALFRWFVKSSPGACTINNVRVVGQELATGL